MQSRKKQNPELALPLGIRAKTLGTSVTLKKGTLLQRPGDQKKMGYVVIHGLLRSYIIDSKGKEHNYMFAPENWIISDVESTEFEQPAVLYIECMEDAEVLPLKSPVLDTGNHHVIEPNERLRMLARRVAVLQRRVIMLMSATATERYKHFLETYPELVNRISQKHIASYLGITPEALSKLRRELTKAKSSKIS